MNGYHYPMHVYGPISIIPVVAHWSDTVWFSVNRCADEVRSHEGVVSADTDAGRAVTGHNVAFDHGTIRSTPGNASATIGEDACSVDVRANQISYNLSASCHTTDDTVEFIPRYDVTFANRLATNLRIRSAIVDPNSICNGNKAVSVGSDAIGRDDVTNGQVQRVVDDINSLGVPGDRIVVHGHVIGSFEVG